jgi:DNA adenine methylase
MGSKRRLAKHILPLILKDRKPGQYYIEPFCGGCNVIEHVDNPRIANDSHYYLIKCLEALANGWEPPQNIGEKDYTFCKDNYPYMYTHYDPLIGYIGFQLSFGAKWFGGYHRGEHRGDRDLQSYNESMKQAPKLKGIEFYNIDYRELKIPDRSIVYCDPPYQNTTQYKSSDFNHEEFWNWCREISKVNQVFILEYSAPNDFICIWEKEHSYMMEHSRPKQKRIEKLFIYGK